MTFSLICFSSLAFAGGDEITLRDGSTLSGDIIAQGNVTQIPTRTQSALIDSAEIWIATSGGVKKIKTSDIKSIRFGPKPQNT